MRKTLCEIFLGGWSFVVKWLVASDLSSDWPSDLSSDWPSVAG